MFTLQPSQLSPQIQAFMTTSIIFVLAVYSYDLLRYFIPSWPSWLKHFVAIPSRSDRSYTSSANNSLLEERSSSHKHPVNSLTGYMPGITVLPSPPPTYLSATPKSTVHGYQAHEPSSFHRTPPLEPPIIFIPTTGHAAGRLMNGSSQCPASLWSTILI